MEIFFFAFATVIFFQICLTLVHLGVKGIIDKDLIAYSRFGRGTHYHGTLAVIFGFIYIFLGMLPSTLLTISILLRFLVQHF